MNDLLMQCQAETKILEFKLDNIRKHLRERIQIVDKITKIELEVLLSMISKYETLPINWQLDEPLVPLQEEHE